VTTPIAPDPGFGFVPGDHVCAFYSSRSAFDDIVADYVTGGLRARGRVCCVVDRPSDVLDRVPAQFARAAGPSGDELLTVRTGEEACLPGGEFTKESYIGEMKARIVEASDRGYGCFRAVGDESFVARNHVDLDEWFAAESELNSIDPGFPHFFFCLYDLTLFDRSTVLRALGTHPRVYVNGILIDNPHYRADPMLIP
jgi:hypothetical protein